MSDLGEFFKIVAEQEKRKKAEAEVLNALAEHLSKISETKEAPVSEEEFEEELSELETDLLESADAMLEEVKPAPLREVSLGPISGNTTTKTSDPLTPLDKRYATKADIEQHYRTYIARIQQQLSTLGGGGEVQLAFMDTATTLVTTSSYTATPRDYYIGVNYPGVVTITLPVATKTGKTFVVKDESGIAGEGVNRYIIVQGSDGATIDGKSDARFGFNWGSLTFVWRGDSWRIV